MITNTQIIKLMRSGDNAFLMMLFKSQMPFKNSKVQRNLLVMNNSRKLNK